MTTRYPVSDNCCTRMGWTEALIDDGSQELHISHAPDADLDDSFLAFCHDEQAMIRVSGWTNATPRPSWPRCGGLRA